MEPISFNTLFQLDKAYIQKADGGVNERPQRAGTGEVGHWIVEGFASTSDLDAQGHVISEDAIKQGADSLQEYQTVLYNHDPNKPIGKILKAEARGGRLFIKVEISKSEPLVWQKIKDGTLSKFSVKGRILDAEPAKDQNSGKNIILIKGLELHEVSIVSVPANVKAKSLAWYVEKAMNDASWSDEDDIEKAKYPFPQCLSDRKKDGYSDEEAHKICGAIRARNVAHMIEWGLAENEEDAIKKIAKKIKEDPSYSYMLGKYLESNQLNLAGKERQVGETMKDCVGRKIAANIKEGKPHDQAIAIAYSQCGASQKGVLFSEEELTDLIKEVTERGENTVEDDVTKAKKKKPDDQEEENAEAEKAAAKAKSKAKPDDQEEEDEEEAAKNLDSVISALEQVCAGEQDAEDAEQVGSVVNALKALKAKKYPPKMTKAEADRAANSNVKGQSGKSGGAKGVGDFWVSGQPKYRKLGSAGSNIDPRTSGPGSKNTQKDIVASPFADAIAELQSMFQELTGKLQQANGVLAAIEEAKGTITKMIEETQSMFRLVPLRKAQLTEDADGSRPHVEEGDASGNAAILKKIVDDKQMRPADKLRKVIEKIEANAAA